MVWNKERGETEVSNERKVRGLEVEWRRVGGETVYPAMVRCGLCVSASGCGVEWSRGLLVVVRGV